MYVCTLERDSDNAQQPFAADYSGFLSRDAVLAWAAGAEVRVASLFDNGNGTDNAPAVQATFANMPLLDLSANPLVITADAGTSAVATITDAITDAIIVTADDNGVYSYVDDIAAGAFNVQSEIGLRSKAVLKSDTLSEHVDGVISVMARAWGLSMPVPYATTDGVHYATTDSELYGTTS